MICGTEKIGFKFTNVEDSPVVNEVVFEGRLLSRDLEDVLVIAKIEDEIISVELKEEVDRDYFDEESFLSDCIDALLDENFEKYTTIDADRYPEVDLKGEYCKYVYYTAV